MGTIYSSAYKKIFGSQDYHCLMLGKQNAGKDEIYRKVTFNNKNYITSISVPIIQYKHLFIYYFDITSEYKNSNFYKLLEHYFKNCLGLIFVIDSSDFAQIDESIAEFNNLLNEEELRDSIFAVFANKQDLPNSIDPSDLSNRMKLNEISDKEIKIFGTSAKTGEWLFESLDWIEENIIKKFQ